MYKLVYNVFNDPMHLQHALELLEGQGIKPDDLRLVIDVKTKELLEGKLVTPEVPEEETSEASEVPSAAPAFDEISLKLWKKIAQSYRVFVIGEDENGADNIDQDLFRAYQTYLDNHRILIIVKQPIAF